ncbi:AAEL017519-PA [Aedes aegypti]|nr:AAEL017519-PA [Aedes aegypti]
MMPVVQQMTPPQQQQQIVPVQNASNTVAVYSEQHAVESFNSEDIGQNLIAIQNHLRSLQLMSSARQQLQLLLQRQHIEHEELKLRHFLELEKFLKQQKEDMKPALQQPQQPAASTITTPSYNNYSTVGSSSSGGSGPELIDLDASVTIVNETNK